MIGNNKNKVNNNKSIVLRKTYENFIESNYVNIAKKNERKKIEYINNNNQLDLPFNIEKDYSNRNKKIIKKINQVKEINNNNIVPFDYYNNDYKNLPTLFCNDLFSKNQYRILSI